MARNKINPNNTPEAKARRKKNNSPAMERKRTENAWHSNPLAPVPTKTIRNQAQSLMRSLYKPSFVQLGREEKRQTQVDEKRAADNSYYLNWLNQQSELLKANDEAARSQVQAAGQQTQQEVAKGWEELRAQLVATGEATPGVVSDMGNATAYDVSAESAKSNAQVAAQREATNQQQLRNIDAASAARQNNFAVMAMSEAKRQSENWEARGKLGDARQQLRLSKAAEAAKEVARLFDKEVEKAQVRGQLRASAATAALEAKRFGLDASKLDLELDQFAYDKYNDSRKFRLDQNEGNRQREENREDNATTRAGDRADNAQTQREERQERREKSQAATAVVTEGINLISGNPKLQRIGARDPQRAKQILTRQLGSALAANAAYQIFFMGGTVNPNTAEQYEQVGVHLPNKWL